MRIKKCQACRQRPVEVFVDDDDQEQPYLVCAECSQRLRRRALRPLEWFNLAATHGVRKHLLHDDFYWDNGVAQQPTEEVSDADKFLAPTLREVKHDGSRLLDYAMTLYALDRETETALRAYDKRDLMALVTAQAAESGSAENRERAAEIWRAITEL